MPHFLYLVTAHSNQRQLSRLVNALLLASPAGEILLHADPTGLSWPPAGFADMPRVHLHPTPRAVRWGDFSLIDVILTAAEWALANVPFDWLVWISGQDYPLGTLDAFESRLRGGHADGWMRYFPAYTHSGWNSGEGRRRYNFGYWDIPSFSRFYWFPAAIRRALMEGLWRFNSSQALIQIFPRYRNNSAKFGFRRWRTPFSPSFPCVAGSPWFNLNSRAVSRLLEFIKTHPTYEAYYRRCYCPDESFLHTILVNDPELTIENEPLRYVNWDAAPSSSPRVISRKMGLDTALASGQPFARKFDLNIDAGCLDELDARILAGVRRRTGTPA